VKPKRRAGMTACPTHEDGISIQKNRNGPVAFATGPFPICGNASFSEYVVLLI
jgi:hypothetical protein